MAVELHAAGVPLTAIAGQLRELRVQVEHIADRFLEFTTEHVFARRLEDPRHRTDAKAAETASLVRRLRPLAQQTVDAELARAMRLFATRQLPATRVRGSRRKPFGRRVACRFRLRRSGAVERPVGAGRAATSIALAAEREVRARDLDGLTTSRRSDHDLGESP
ncbi:hypothetical protein ABZ922_02150 [Streptomyces shenzhenensis]|uniref:hypothetical protein n=1 Tax=Streptomyces shenzhenensis TaxID=943815 RepID=UPI0033C1492C